MKYEPSGDGPEQQNLLILIASRVVDLHDAHHDVVVTSPETELQREKDVVHVTAFDAHNLRLISS